MNSAIKRAVLAEQETVKQFRIYKTRLSTDDGWRFIVAKSPNRARIKANGARVLRPTQIEMEEIALRALLNDGEDFS